MKYWMAKLAVFLVTVGLTTLYALAQPTSRTGTGLSNPISDERYAYGLAALKQLASSRPTSDGELPDNVVDEAYKVYKIAVVERRGDIVALVMPYRPHAQSGCRISMSIADSLLQEDKLDEAYRYFAGLAENLYHAETCHYRMAEIRCRQGRLEDALKQFDAAKTYELQLRSSPFRGEITKEDY